VLPLIKDGSCGMGSHPEFGFCPQIENDLMD
jgi:hypothetical protein